GESWRRITSRNTDAAAVVILPSANGRVLAGFEAQGVLRSDDGGKTFVDSNAGFNHRVIRSAAVNPVDSQNVLILVQSAGDLLYETLAAGQTWTELPPPGSNRHIERVFATLGEWWAALSGGGICRYDAQRRLWTDVPFRAGANTAKHSGVATTRVRAERPVKPAVEDLIESGDVVFAAAKPGLWRLNAKRTRFDFVPTKNLPPKIDCLMAAKDGAVLAVTDGALWSSDAQ